MSEVQRYMVSYATGVGESAMPSETGNWVKFTDHASRVRELEEAVRILKAELSIFRQGMDDHENGPFIEYADGLDDVEAVAFMKALDMARADTDKNPIAADAVKEAGR
jgi:hypothetical protein